MNAQLLSVNTENFAQEVLNQPGLTLVDFWAEWCGPCRAQTPILEELATEWDGQVRITKLNVDESPELAQQYNIMSIPTLILFRDGQIVRQVTGVQTPDQLRTLIGDSNLT